MISEVVSLEDFRKKTVLYSITLIFVFVCGYFSAHLHKKENCPCDYSE